MAADAFPRDIAAWRREQRARLMAMRAGAAPEQRSAWEGALRERLAVQLAASRGAIVGLYWPVRGEFDPLPLAAPLLAQGRSLALPTITAKAAPLEYRPWQPDDAVVDGAFGIPVPNTILTVMPDIILVPCLGFDLARFRLGYGGGYFDRTLAAPGSRPVAIGAAFELGALATIYPQPHDVALDAIVTERRAV
jgi:5-formyltetrahydrofolate cyclo-ligase